MVNYFNISNIINSNYKNIKDVQFWNDDIQIGIYHYFYLNNNIAAVIEFRDFMEALDYEKVEAYGRGENVFSFLEHMRPTLINPVIVLINNHYFQRNPYKDLDIEYLSILHNERPHLFYKGNRSRGEHSGTIYYHPPLVEAVISGKIKIIEYFVENVDNWENIENNSYSDWNMWWNFPLGGNLLSYFSAWDNNRRIHNFLVENGIEEYLDISERVIYVSSNQDTNVWSKPDFNSEILGRIGREEILKPIVLTAYKINGYQWIYFEMENEIKGWAPFGLSINYESGK
jgi:hypothetical protein